MALEKITEFDYPIIDADLHIFECDEIFDYLEPKFREELAGDHILMPEMQDRLSDAGVGGSVGTMEEWHEEAPVAITQNPLTFGERSHRGTWYRMHMESKEAWQLTKKQPGYVFPGASDPRVRLWCMDKEGIDVGIVRSTAMGNHLTRDDPLLVDALCRAYNNWMHDFCSADPTRLYPEALLPVGHMDLALKELERTANLGFKGTCVPGSTAAPKPLSDSYWDPLWSRLQELGWPLCVHAAFNPALDSAAQFLLSPNKMASSSSSAYFAIFVGLNFMLDNIVTLGEVTLGGMCDKFPNLNVYFIEAGHSWVGEALYRLDKAFHAPPADDFLPGHPFGGKTPPSEIFERQIYVPFEGGDQHYMSDMSFHALSKNLIWASDIPHWDADGPWEGVGALRLLKVSMDAQQAIMGGNFAKLLGIPAEKKVGTSEAAVAAA